MNTKMAILCLRRGGEAREKLFKELQDGVFPWGDEGERAQVLRACCERDDGALMELLCAHDTSASMREEVLVLACESNAFAVLDVLQRDGVDVELGCTRWVLARIEGHHGFDEALIRWLMAQGGSLYLRGVEPPDERQSWLAHALQYVDLELANHLLTVREGEIFDSEEGRARAERFNTLIELSTQYYAAPSSQEQVALRRRMRGLMKKHYG